MKKENKYRLTKEEQVELKRIIDSGGEAFIWIGKRPSK
jgi:hypothetical protein